MAAVAGFLGTALLSPSQAAPPLPGCRGARRVSADLGNSLPTRGFGFVWTLATTGSISYWGGQGSGARASGKAPLA